MRPGNTIENVLNCYVDCACYGSHKTFPEFLALLFYPIFGGRAAKMRKIILTGTHASEDYRALKMGYTLEPFPSVSKIRSGVFSGYTRY